MTESEVPKAMTANDKGPPMDPDTEEASPRQLQAARAQGDTFGRAVEMMIGSATLGGGEQRAGDYLVAVAVELAEGMYELDRGALVWREPGDANAHLEIIVRDRGDGRFVPGLSVWVTVIDDEGHEVGDRVHPMFWHPLAYHYGRNWRVPKDGHYSLRVRIDPAGFPRHDRVNGRRFVAPVEVEFRDVLIVTGQR